VAGFEPHLLSPISKTAASSQKGGAPPPLSGALKRTS
jgi:hypothetical protein